MHVCGRIILVIPWRTEDDDRIRSQAGKGRVATGGKARTQADALLVLCGIYTTMRWVLQLCPVLTGLIGAVRMVHLLLRRQLRCSDIVLTSCLALVAAC